jgi:hypothetical protein
MLNAGRAKMVARVNAATVGLKPISPPQKTLPFKTKLFGYETVLFYNEEDNTCFEVGRINSGLISIDVLGEYPNKEYLLKNEEFILKQYFQLISYRL